MPTGGGLQVVVDVVDVLHAFGLEPLAEGGCALLGVDRNAVLPGGAAAQDAVELHSGFSGQFERLAELRVADAGRQINERLGGDVGGFVEQLDRFFLGVGFLSAKALRAFDELHVHRHFDLEHVDAVAVFAELAHALGDDMRFLLGVVETLLVRAFFVADELQEEGDVVGAALVADALDPGVLLVVDVLGIEGRVVEQNLDAVRAGFFQAARRPVVEQIAQAAGTGLVVSGLLIGEQQAGVLGAALGGGQSPLGIEQDGAGMRGENFGDQRS